MIQNKKRLKEILYIFIWNHIITENFIDKIIKKNNFISNDFYENNPNIKKYEDRLFLYRKNEIDKLKDEFFTIIESYNIFNWDELFELRESIKENCKKYYENEELSNLAQNIFDYINSNYNNIDEELKTIKNEIKAKKQEKQKVHNSEKNIPIEYLIKCKKKEYQLQLDIIWLTKKYDEIKYELDEKLRIYDWTTYEEKNKQKIFY